MVSQNPLEEFWEVIKELVLMMVRLRSAMVRCHPSSEPGAPVGLRAYLASGLT